MSRGEKDMEIDTILKTIENSQQCNIKRKGVKGCVIRLLLRRK